MISVLQHVAGKLHRAYLSLLALCRLVILVSCETKRCGLGALVTQNYVTTMVQLCCMSHGDLPLFLSVFLSLSLSPSLRSVSTLFLLYTKKYQKHDVNRRKLVLKNTRSDRKE